MIDITDVRVLCSDETTVLTQHLQKRLRERGIKYDDIVHAIMHGEIIEQYENDFPHPSCLILGVDAGGEPLHIVCGVSGGTLWIVTTYRPSADKWETDFKTRKGLEQ